MSDIRITPGSSIMSFTSSLNYVETLKQDDSGSLNLYGSGSLGRTEIFSIDGNNGRLFTVTDDLSDSLFSVNTIAGLPVIEAFANNTVVMGQYGTNALVVSGSKVGIGTSSPSKLLTVRHGDAEGLRIEYNGNDNNLFFDASNIQSYNLTNPSDLKINPFGGKVFIGNPTLITSETFQVNGSGYFNSNVNVDGGLTINGSLNSGGSNFAGYRQGGDNIILKGNSTGVSGIFFQSEKDGTNINHTSDYGYIQFHPHGIDGTTGESNKLVIGVANDADDMVILQSPYKNGVKISYLNSSSGTGGTLHTVWNAGNHGSGSGLDADLLDGKHATDFIPTTHAINSISNGTGFLKNNGSGVWSYDNSTYDNYQSWILKTNGVQRTTIQTGGILDLVAGSNVSLSYGAGGVVTINSTDTNTTYSAGTGLTLTGTVFTPTFGTTAGTVAQGNDSRIINGQIAHGWGDHAGLYIPVGQKGVANGVATLDASGLIPTTQLPSYVDDVIEAADLTALNALPVGDKQTGKIYVARDTNKSYRWSGSAFIYITSGAVDSVAGKTGVVTLVKGDVGLGNVDNTSDSIKSVASAAKLTTARTIGGVSFDGTANINLPGVNTTGNQSTTGNSATATTLATARTLTIGAIGKPFNGSADVAWSLAEIGAMSTSHVANAISSTDINTWNDAVTKSGTQTITGAKTFNSIINFSNNVGGIQGTIGDNDFWRIIGNNTASNAGYLEIATADDGNEPIYVRQYTGVFSSLTRTAVLLDGSGNTSFPGTITAGSFIKQGGTNAEFLMASGGTKNSDDFYQVNKGVVSTQNSLSVNGLQTLSIASTSTNFDGDLSNITFEGTFANFNGSSNSSKSLGFTLAAPTSINQGIYYKTWYSASTPWRRLWDTSNFSQSNVNSWNQAVTWGNHASAGYALANGTNATGTWGINITGNATNATNSSNTLRVTFNDGPRNLSDRLPNTFARSVVFDFVSSGIVGGVGNFAGVMTFSPWEGTTSSTGDSSYQLGFINETGINGSGLPGLVLRKGIDNTWGNFVNLLHTGNTTISYSGNTLQLLRNGNVISSTTINTGNTYTNGSNITIASNQISVVSSPIFSGNVTAVDFIGTSDFNLKENIETYDEKPLNTEYRTFNFKNDDTPRIGLIAQELEQHHPEFVRTDMNGEKSISYIDLHSAEIAYLKKYCARLEEELNELKSKI